MRSVLISILLLFSFVISAQVTRAWGFGTIPVPQEEAGEDSLIAYYRFENNYSDEQGNYDGTAMGGIGFNEDEYTGTYALDVSASLEGVDIGAVNFGASGFTISMHVKRVNTANTTANVIFSNRGSTSGADGFAIWINSYGTHDGRILVYTGDGSNQDNAYTGTDDYTSGQYNHIVCIYDGAGTWTIYVDGADETDDSSTQDDFAQSGNTAMIGNYNTLNYSHINTIDDVKIFNIPLSGDALTALLAE